MAALLFLSLRGDRPEVRAFFDKVVHKILTTEQDDAETVMTLRITRRFLDAGSFDKLARGLRSGAFRHGGSDEIAETMASIDRARAAEVFLEQLSNRTQPAPARAGSATAMGRMPEYRSQAVALVAQDPDPRVVTAFLEGLRYGRYGGVELQRAARVSGDPERMRVFLELKLKDLEGGLRTLGEFEAAMGPERANELEMPRRIEEYRTALAETKADLKDPAAALLK